MNSDIITKVADMIRTEPKHYHQSSWGIHWKSGKGDYFVSPSCYTPCCIAGHILVASNKVETNDNHWSGMVVKDGDHYNLKKDAQEKAGLTTDQASTLFSSYWPREWFEDEDSPLPLCYGSSGNNVPASNTAIKVMRRLAKHGFSHDSFAEYHRDINEEGIV